MNSAKMVVLFFDRDENILEKEENAAYQQPAHDVFKKLFTQVCKKSGLCGKEFKVNKSLSVKKMLNAFALEVLL